MKLAILTKEAFSSPRILAESLVHQLSRVGVETQIFFDINVLNRLVSYQNSKLRFHYWLQKKIVHYLNDRKIIRALKKMDAVVISECIPNGFWKQLYNVEKLKSILQIPVLIYEVYYLGNAITQEAALKNNKDALMERYDGHLFVSPVTETKGKVAPNAFSIGLMANTWDLQPLPKKKLMVLVDFAQPGFEPYREMQIRQLEKADIPYISLERPYIIEEIRGIYREVSIYFMQSFEAFGLPILECLCTGAQVFTPDSSWPMSWRLDKNPQLHGPGILPACFTLYNNEDDLLQKLLDFKENFNPVETPLEVFNEFLKTYPAFYEGNQTELIGFLDFIKSFKN